MDEYDARILDALTDEWEPTGVVASKICTTLGTTERLKIARHLRTLAAYGFCEGREVRMGQRDFQLYRRKR